jgi:superfamily II DNA or RNA helicase
MLEAEELLEGDQHGILLGSSTGAGKTVEALKLAELVMRQRPEGYVLVLVPTRNLLEQWELEVRGYARSGAWKRTELLSMAALMTWCCMQEPHPITWCCIQEPHPMTWCCIQKLCLNSGYVLVLVPTRNLLEQWELEVRCIHNDLVLHTRAAPIDLVLHTKAMPPSGYVLVLVPTRNLLDQWELEVRTL